MREKRAYVNRGSDWKLFPYLNRGGLASTTCIIILFRLYNSSKNKLCIDLVLTMARNAALIVGYHDYAVRLAEKMEEMYGV